MVVQGAFLAKDGHDAEAEGEAGGAGIVAMLTKPPLVYVVAALILLCVLTAVFQRYKEELSPYLFGLLDCCAGCARGLTAGGQGCCYVAKRCCYPVKESVFFCVDKCDRCLHPHKDKAKKMQADAPTFHF
ncbi:unnamed protein product [Prorocentrum cordatum]|uniref:SREBP regulating gene protein n=1 Tax=Prorocentrum cordatum TaxID=2364126 RepID=A0ABN9XH09_9DINO|nr:unnamed protein product [Polarella glacialis]|mmetsp:Transcript_2833/g.7535  ORF Transcript_2833/g.7535 Transcript_2833/m.7535 type:complete len:130 (-) Transcript_2833:95-484(-)